MKSKHIFRLILALVFASMLSLGALAAEEETETLYIASTEDFLAFAEACRLDSYSRGLSVKLEKDIDLSGAGFRGVPWFGGSFDGNGHSISGLHIDCDGSAQGLFRYLSQDARVENLHVQGSVTPGGSRARIGGIAGENAGVILNCSFLGTVSGGDCVGGIAGRNAVTGVVEDCRMKGEVSGDHFAGGIVGENSGVIRGSLNSATVNTTAQQNSVELEDVSLETLAGTEAANTVTDIGGIAGLSTGVIRSSENRGNVGYKHMGYNVGGIAGTQQGYITDCINYGSIRGRKEVGGIVGQMEPASLIEYSEDALQILEQQLGGMSYLVNRAAANAQSNSEPLYGQLNTLYGQTQSAAEALGPLLTGGIPDSDTLQAAKNTLSASLGAMGGTVSAMTGTLENTVTGLANDVQALSGQISAMGATIGAAKEKIGGSITDVSDEDSEEEFSGKTADCVNHGSVLADLNAGGVAGAMAMENDLDLLEDWELLGDDSMNFESRLRAVLLRSDNFGEVTATKQYAGGIVGWQPMGLVKGCVNSGTIDAAAAEYVGGVAGQSRGWLRECSANCVVSGADFVGGIAGSAGRATDCRSMVILTDARERQGAILGAVEAVEAEEDEVLMEGNYYHPVEADTGAIDGISYAGVAEPLALQSFLKLEELPELFTGAFIRFRFDDGSEEVLRKPVGSRLEEKDIPALPEKEGCEAEWVGLDAAKSTDILFDMSFDALYTPHHKVIEDYRKDENGLSLLLLEGDFPEGDSVSLGRINASPALAEGESLLKKNAVIFSGKGQAERLRLRMPEDCDSTRIRLCVLREDEWTERSFRVEKSYLVFDWTEGDSAFALVQTPYELSPIPVFSAALVVLLAVIGLIRKKKKVKEDVSL